MSTIELRVTVVDPELAATTGMWGDGTGGWLAPAAAWVGRLAALGVPYDVRPSLSEPVNWLVVDPTGTAGDVAGDRIIVGAPPATAEQTVELLVENLGALVLPDLRNVLVLRLDDPGAAVKEHLSSWAHAPVGAEGWSALWEAVDGFGRLSVFCCPGYVRDDGSVVSSRDVLPEEWASLDEGVRRGLTDFECHGYTHMHPDTERWSRAGDRSNDEDWFRELWPPKQPDEPQVHEQEQRLRAWQAATGHDGTSLVAPGERWGLNTLAAARNCGFRLFNSWGICFLDRDVPTWSVGIGSPYLDAPDPALFAEGLPQVGYWHDRDMAVNGPTWIGEQLSAWRDCGVTRTMSFADLAAAYEPIDAALVDGQVLVRSAPDVRLRVIRS